MSAPDSLVLTAPRQGTALLAGLLLTLLVTAAATDPAGRLLVLPAAAVCVGLLARDLLLGPVLQADLAGLTLQSGWHRVHAPWPQVEAMAVRTYRRTPVLDVELAGRVVVLGRGRLGRAPAEVLADLASLRAASS